MGALASRHRAHELNAVRKGGTFRRFSSTENNIENELFCPVCNEELQEPKIIPKCQHNVCRKCLEGLVKSNFKSTRCPVCRRVTGINSKEKVSELSTNARLVRRIKDAPGWYEKNSVREALKESTDQLTITETQIQERHKQILDHVHIQSEETKRRIREQANLLVTLIQEHERNLLQEVDVAFDVFKNKREELNANELKSYQDELSVLKLKAEEMISTADIMAVFEGHEDVVQRFHDLRQRFIEATEKASKNKNSVDATLNFKCNRNTETALTFDNAIGSINMCPCANPLPLQISRKDPNIQTNKYQFCQAISTVQQQNSKLGCFLPVSVAVSPNGNEIAILDKANKCVYLLNEKRVRFTFVVEGSPNDLTFCCKNNDIVLVDSKRSCLESYHHKELFNCSSKSRDFVSHSFNSITTHASGRFVITSNMKSKACSSTVLVFNCHYELKLEFGHGQLVSPEKAIYFNDQYFISDSEGKAVKVFDKKGLLTRRIGSKILTRPAGLALDEENGYILVCDSAEDSVLVFDELGNIASDFKTAKKPLNVAKTQDGKLVVACEGSSSVQFFLYFYILIGMS